MLRRAPRRLRTPDERAATHRKRRATIAAKRAEYQRQREAQGEAAPQLGLEFTRPASARRSPPAPTPAVASALDAFATLAARVLK